MESLERLLALRLQFGAEAASTEPALHGFAVTPELLSL